MIDYRVPSREPIPLIECLGYEARSRRKSRSQHRDFLGVAGHRNRFGFRVYTISNWDKVGNYREMILNKSSCVLYRVCSGKFHQ